jgi:hypothetical protein
MRSENRDNWEKSIKEAKVCTATVEPSKKKKKNY